MPANSIPCIPVLAGWGADVIRSRPKMIAPALRMWLFALAVGYGAMGAILFAAPSWASNNFAWRLAAFDASTLGGWCIGTAWACLVIARRGAWPAMFCSILYLA